MGNEITREERAAMRAHIRMFGRPSAADSIKALDALDAAEAEAARLREMLARAYDAIDVYERNFSPDWRYQQTGEYDAHQLAVNALNADIAAVLREGNTTTTKEGE